MLRRLLGLLQLISCDCGHAAAHEAPCTYRRYSVCSECDTLALRIPDWHDRRFRVWAARHPYGVR